MQKVIHISTVHYWQDARILNKECKSLASNGFHVTLLIQHTHNKIVDGVYIKGLPIANRKIDRLFYVIPSMFLTIFKEDRNTILHLHDPELLPFGILFKILGFRVIYDVHEDLPADILNKEWIPNGLKKGFSKAVKWFEFLATAGFDGVVTVTPEISKRFAHVKNVMVKNFPKLNLFLSPKKNQKEDYVIYIGDIREVRGAKEMVSAISSTQNKLKLKLGGRITPASLKEELEMLDSKKRVEFLGWVPHKNIPEVLNKAICGMVVLHPLEGYKEAYSVKMFEYMAAGIPVIASDFALWRKIIEEAKCGILVNPLDPNEIAKSIDYLSGHPEEAKAMGANGRKAVIEKYSWENEEKKLIRFYAEILST